MRFLLDTHTVLWLRESNPRLNRIKWEPVLFSSDNEILVSIVSLWEITIKKALGRLDFEGEIEEFAATLESTLDFHLLPVEPTHLGRLGRLPLHHGDPFDRLLIAQAIEEKAVAVTNDGNWKKYPVKVLW
jgi:PIN domain nuclease of toxin-antitoxin system